jgi:hypothetical protein
MIIRKIAAGVSAALLVGGVAWTALASGSSGAAASHDTSWPVAAVPGAAEEAARAARADGNEVIRVRDKQVRGQFIDVGKKGESAGDYFVFESQLLKRGTQVGRLSARCMLGITTYTCEGTALLEGRGKIVIAGTFFRNDANLGITGGTARFKDARGQMTVEEGKVTHLVFELVPR